MNKQKIIKKAKIMWNEFHTPKEVMEFVFDETEKEFKKKIEEYFVNYVNSKGNKLKEIHHIPKKDVFWQFWNWLINDRKEFLEELNNEGKE